jgi:hypothetical protein
MHEYFIRDAGGSGYGSNKQNVLVGSQWALNTATYVLSVLVGKIYLIPYF